MRLNDFEKLLSTLLHRLFGCFPDGAQASGVVFKEVFLLEDDCELFAMVFIIVFEDVHAKLLDLRNDIPRLVVGHVVLDIF